MFQDLEFTDDGKIVTFSASEGTHLHLQMDDVKEVKFLHTTNQQGLPSYSVWFIDENQEPMLRVYLRKSDIDETNQPRHDLFMGLIEKYGESLPVA
jgi:putative heme iron utilization protein